MTSLSTKLTAALQSRDDRLIRRRLPDPSSQSFPLTDFTSNDYLSLSQSPRLRSLFLSKLQRAPNILGSGGSRLLVNGRAHADLESRLAHFFHSPTALLFNSGFDANVGFFSCVPQEGDAVVFDEYIHASVHDGVRSSRASGHAFAHNSVGAFRVVLEKLLEEDLGFRTGRNSVFVAVESLYSMDGTFAPLTEIVEIIEELFPAGNGYVIVDEAHATGIYGPKERGMVASLGLENRVFARLHTFGKALAGTGAVMLLNTLTRDYMLNYARSLIYTTSLSYANIIAADCAFDLLEDGTAEELSKHLLSLSTLLLTLLRPHISRFPAYILSLPSHLSHSIPPSPIIPILTTNPRSLSTFLLKRGMNARPITWPTVPRGKDRVRVCLHAGNGSGDVERLVEAMVEWADGMLREERRKEKEVMMESKL